MQRATGWRRIWAEREAWIERGRAFPYWGLVGLAALLIPLVFVRLWRLSEAPSNVTGDEATFLDHALRVLRGDVGFFSLLGDGSQPAASFYFIAGFIKTAGEADAVIGMRLSSVALSLLALLAFYLYVRRKVATVPALLALALLGTNYIFLNFSRSTWFNAGAVATGLFSFLFLEMAVEKRKWGFAALAGLFAAFTLYGYFGSKVFPLASGVYLGYLVLRGRLDWRTALAYGAVFATVMVLVFLPQFLYIRDHYDQYTMRMDATFIGNAQTPYAGHSDVLGIFWHQLTHTVRGFLLLDPAVGGEGVENARYGPIGEAMVDTTTRVLFFAAVAAILVWRRKEIAQPALAVLATLATAQMLAVLPPNLSRGLFFLFFMYLVIALLFDLVWSNEKLRPLTAPALLLLVGLVSLWNVQHYFDWATGQELAQAREPAFAIEMTPQWVRLQNQRIASGQPDLVISSPEWESVVDLARRPEQGLAIGGPGVGPGAFRDPSDVAIGPLGDIYVTDSLNNRIQKLSSQGDFLAEAGSAGTAKGQFNEPWGIAVDAAGFVYVADTWNHRIQKFDGNLNFVAVWGAEDLFGPRDVAVDPDGNVWVSDTGDGRVVEYSPSGDMLGILGEPGGKPGQLREPTGLAFGAGGRLFVADAGNLRIQSFDADLKFLGAVDMDWEVNEHPFLAADPEGGLLVSEGNGGRILRVDGRRVMPILERRGGDAELEQPRGMALDALGFVYIADAARDRVLRLPLAVLR